MKIYRRPMTAEERDLLKALSGAQGQGCLDVSARYFICLVGGPVLGMLVAAMPLSLLKRAGKLPDAVLLLVLAAGTLLGFVVGLRVVLWEARTARETRARHEVALARGQVEVLRCEAADAVELMELEDEGPGFFVDVGGGEVLFLQGQYLMEMDFPCRRFEVIRLPNGGEILDVRCDGDRLAPSRTVDLDDLEEGYLPADGEVLRVSLATLEDDLRRLG